MFDNQEFLSLVNALNQMGCSAESVSKALAQLSIAMKEENAIENLNLELDMDNLYIIPIDDNKEIVPIIDEGENYITWS